MHFLFPVFFRPQGCRFFDLPTPLWDGGDGDGDGKDKVASPKPPIPQMLLAVYVLFLNHFLLMGVSSLFLLAFGSLAGALYVLPIALFLERQKWPTTLRPALMAQFVLLALAGTVFQVFLLLGVKKASPAIVSAMPNLGPGITFIIAACVRFEKFSMWCTYSRAKVIGTIVCLTGAIAMSVWMSPAIAPNSINPRGSSNLNNPANEAVNLEWILGCLYMFLSVILLSCGTIFQATVMRSFPAPFSLFVVTSLLSCVMAALLQIIMEGKLDAGSSQLGLTSITGIVLLAAALTSSTNSYLVWCVKKRGPVMVSIFSPVQTVCSAVLSAIFLKQIISISSLTAMFFMFIGLYIVLWAKHKEYDLQDADSKLGLLVHDSKAP